VATYETILSIPQSVDEAFAFVSDFRNAAKWDPRTFSVDKTTDGEIGVGTRFMLTGGMFPEATVERLHLPKSMAGMALPYDVVEFDAPHEFVLEGESRLVRYRDHLEFWPDGNGTKLRYFAELRLRGPLSIMEPLLARMFQRIGDDATRDLPATVARAT
jgi:hypothetical protein